MNGITVEDGQINLPRPSWSGFPQFGIMKQQYGEFVVEQEIQRTAHLPEQARMDLDSAQRSLRQAQDSLAANRENLESVRGSIAALEARLENITAAGVAEQATALRALPFVIGTRLEVTGNLAVVIRVSAHDDETDRNEDIGDFDISFSPREQDHSMVTIVRRGVCVCGDILDPYNLHSFRLLGGHPQAEESSYGEIRNMPAMEELSAVDYLVRIHDTIAANNGYRMYCRMLQAPEPAWQFHLAIDDLRESLVRQHLATQGKVRDVLSTKRRLERDYEARIENSLESVRTYTRLVRERQADYNRLRGGVEARVVMEPEKWTHDLIKIATFPGVMGVKFVRGEMIVHVRTSVVHDNRRYDLGDFELLFGKEGLRVNRTRGDVSYYWQGDYFCFGDRSGHISEMARSGQYVTCTNLAINSMNHVNRENQGSIRNRIPEIPMAMLWQTRLVQSDQPAGEAPVVIEPPVPPRRRRGRRRPRRSLDERMGYQAVNTVRMLGGLA